MCTEVGRRQKEFDLAGVWTVRSWGGGPQEVGLRRGPPLAVHSLSLPMAFIATSPRKRLFKGEEKNFKAATTAEG